MPGRQGPDARLQLHGEIARGGMGAVLKGRDTDLGRDVAVKVLLETHAGKTELARRFVEEAQIAGQLQHPGVTPVYELGLFPDRRPYFTMKLVKGKTLAALLAARTGPEEDRPRFLGIFLQVCQTLAYAHARGVIHRDLKPSNVMVGAFGEVQVMDWGLAKVLAEGGVADEQRAQRPEVSVIRTQRSAGSSGPGEGSQTQAGSVLGTPAYLAPEQARGDLELVDERADVFGLGAVLCEVLTGRPPYTGTGPEATRKAQAARLDDALARLDRCGADPELVELARRCLAAEPWDRPRDAGAVAAALTAYQESVADRLRQAELAHAAEVARVEEAKATAAQERKARRLTLGLAAAVLLLVAFGAAGGLWAQRQHAEREAEALRRRQAVEAALDRAVALRQQARWAEARAVLEQTRDQLGEKGPEDLRRRVEQAAADLALVDRLEGIRLKRATMVEGKFDSRTAERDYAAAFREAGLAVEGEGVEAAAVAARIRASAVREPLVAALDDWAAVAPGRWRRGRLLEVARLADPDPWRDRFRDPKVGLDRAALEKLAGELLGDEAALAKTKAPLLAALGTQLYWAKADAVPLLRAAQARHPGDFWLNFLLGSALDEAKRWDEAVGYNRAALAVRPDSVATRNSLGRALQGQERLDEAIKEYRAAIALDPKYAHAHNNLGAALREQGKLDEAIREYRTAIALDPKYTYARNNLGLALQGQKRLDEAIKEYRTAIALDRKSAPPHNNLGNALREQGKLDEAIREHRAAILLDPKYAIAHYNLGNALRDQGKLDEAIREYRAAIALDPKVALAHNNLGNALRAKGQIDEAIREHRAAIALDPKSAIAHYNLGIALREQGQLAEAREAIRRCLELLPPGHPLRQPATRQLQQCEQSLALEAKLPAVLGGREEPADDAERLALAWLCQQPSRQLNAASARFWAGAFARDPKLAGDMEQQHRYNAACAAALAGCGFGKDDPPPDDAMKAKLRRQALGWLRADLAAYAKQLEDKSQSVLVRQRLQHWQQDADFRGVRDPDALAKLPEAERQSWRALWAEVEALLRKAGPGE
jgi:serine/threonine-protein kinase